MGLREPVSISETSDQVQQGSYHTKASVERAGNCQPSESRSHGRGATHSRILPLPKLLQGMRQELGNKQPAPPLVPFTGQSQQKSKGKGAGLHYLRGAEKGREWIWEPNRISSTFVYPVDIVFLEVRETLPEIAVKLQFQPYFNLIWCVFIYLGIYVCYVFWIPGGGR